MFRIECFVEDKHLAEALRVLAKLRALNVSSQPVENALLKQGKLVQDHQRSKPQYVRLYEELEQGCRLNAPIAMSAIKSIAKQAGIPTANLSALLARLKADKLIRSKGKGVYLLIK